MFSIRKGRPRTSADGLDPPPLLSVLNPLAGFPRCDSEGSLLRPLSATLVEEADSRHDDTPETVALIHVNFPLVDSGYPEAVLPGKADSIVNTVIEGALLLGGHFSNTGTSIFRHVTSQKKVDEELRENERTKVLQIHIRCYKLSLKLSTIDI